MSDVGSNSDMATEQASVSSATCGGNNSGGGNNAKAVDALRRQVNKLQARIDVLERQLTAVVAYNANTTAALAAAVGGSGGVGNNNNAGPAASAQGMLAMPFAMRGAATLPPMAGFPFGAVSPTQPPPGVAAGMPAYMPTLSPNMPQPLMQQQSQQQQQQQAGTASGGGVSSFAPPLLPTSHSSTAGGGSSGNTTTVAAGGSSGVTPTSMLHNSNTVAAAVATSAATAAGSSHVVTPTKTDEAGTATAASTMTSGGKVADSDAARFGQHANSGTTSTSALQSQQQQQAVASPLAGGMYNAASTLLHHQQQQRDDALLAMLSAQPTPNMTPTNYGPIFPNVNATMQSQLPHSASDATAGAGMLPMQMTAAGASGGGGGGHVDAALKSGNAAPLPFAAMHLAGGRPPLQQQQQQQAMMLAQQQQQHMATMMGMTGFANMYGSGSGGGGHAAYMMHGSLTTPTSGNASPHGLDMAHAAAMMNGGNNSSNGQRVGGMMPGVGMPPPSMQPFLGLHSPVGAPGGFGPAGMMMPAPGTVAAGGGGGGAAGFMLGSGSNNNSGGGGVVAGNNAMFALAGQQQQQQQTMQTTVTLDPARANNDALERVCQQPWLKEVCLKGCKNISNFTPLMRLRNLWKLNLQGCGQYVDDAVVQMIGTHNRRLSRLNLCGCERITDAAPLSHLSFLFDLNLSGCPIDNTSIDAIARNCQQLSRLAINSCPQLTDIRSLANLKELKLLYCRYSDKIDPDSISAVLNAIGSSLLTLNVDGIRFAQLDLSQLPPVMALKNLNIKDNVEVTDLFWLTSLPAAEKTFAALEMLDAEGCTTLSQLGRIAALPSLRTLRLSHTAITQVELTQLAGCPVLTTLYIDHCANITNVECLASVSTLTKVYVDQRFAAGSSSSNGIAALQQTGHIDIVYAAPATNNNNSSSSGGGGVCGGNNNNSTCGSSSAAAAACGFGSAASLYAAGVLGAFSPTASPTTAFVPAMPCIGGKGNNSNNDSSNGTYALSPGSVVDASSSSGNNDAPAKTNTPAV